MDCKEIIITWLKEHNCDGLCHPDTECGCGLDDLMPCDENNCGECEPAKKRKDCKSCENYDTCEMDAKEYNDGCFIVAPTPPPIVKPCLDCWDERSKALTAQLAEAKDIIASLKDEITLMKHEIDGDLSDWRSCTTCTELLNKHRNDFDNGDGICWESCVHDTLNEGQTPEDLLASYNPTPAQTPDKQ